MSKGSTPDFTMDFSEIMEQSSLPMAVCDASGKSLFLNTAYAEYFIENGSREDSLKSRFVHEETWQEIVHYCTNYGEWDSYGILAKSAGEEIILKVKASTYVPPGKKTKLFVLFFTETNEARRRIFRQGQLLKASSESSTLLVGSKDLNESLNTVVKAMGKAVQADRCYVYESTFLPDSDQIYASKVAQWERFEEQAPPEDIQMVSYTILPMFYETLHSGLPYNKTRDDFVDKSGRFMESRQIRSLICLPIFRDNALWGFMGFDDCQEPRKWDEQEVASLTLLTNSLSSVLSNTELRIELEKKNTQLESAIRGSKDSLWDYDIQKERLYYSPQFLELLGYSEGELKGNLGDLLKIVHPDDLTKLFHRLQELTKNGGKIKDRELRLTHKKGSTLWVRVNAGTHVDLSGNAVRISGSNTDITLEKTYENKIAESQEKYIELVDNLREIVFQLDHDGKIIFLNRAWKMLTGLSLNSSIGNSLIDYVDEADKPVYLGLQKKLLEEGNSYLNCTVSLKGKGDTRIWTEIYGRSIVKKGTAPYILGTIIDVSQRRIAEEKLKENEARYRLITENISDLVTLQDAKGRFIYVSPSVKTVLGMNVRDLLGKTPRQVWEPSELNGTAWEKDNFDVNNTSRKSYVFKKHNGTAMWLETMRSLVYTEGDDGYIIQSATRDISAFKEAENNLKAALDQQRELIELKSNFISMASHEFRTPLTTIRSSVQLLEEYGKASPEEQRMKMEKHYGRIKEQIERVTRLMNDVLTLGKFDAGRTPFHSSKQDILRFMDELISDHFSNQGDGRHIEFSSEGKAMPILFDSSLLSHIMINLISNAFKYSEGKKNPELFVQFNPKKLQIIVKDYGIGIPSEDLERVFESFYRSKNAINVPGTGLGLVITKEFVELHKGTIHIESELNKKTSVIVELPT